MRTEQFVDPKHPKVLPLLQRLHDQGEIGLYGVLDLTEDIEGLSYGFGVVDGAPCVVTVWGDEPVLPDSLQGVPVLRVVLKDSGPTESPPEPGFHHDGSATAAVTLEGELWYLVVHGPAFEDAMRLRKRILNIP